MDAESDSHRNSWFAIVLLICFLLIGMTSVSAQGSPTPLSIGENQIGAVPDADSSVAYSLTVAAPQSVEIQVLAITPGFAPTFTVFAPGGGEVFDAANPGTQTVAHGTASLYSQGVYTITVSSANGAAGQFLISTQAGEPLALPLTIGQNQTGAISDPASGVQYGLSVGMPQSVEIQVLAITVGFAPRFSVFAPDGSVIFEAANADGQNIARRVVNLPGAGTYIVEVRSANGTTGQFLISPQPAAPATTPTTTPTFSSCQAISLAHYAVRSRPIINSSPYNIIYIGDRGETAHIFGWLPEENVLGFDKWYYLQAQGYTGWSTSGTWALSPSYNCDHIPQVTPPPSPTPTPRLVETIAALPLGRATVTPIPTAAFVPPTPTLAPPPVATIAVQPPVRATITPSPTPTITLPPHRGG